MRIAAALPAGHRALHFDSYARSPRRCCRHPSRRRRRCRPLAPAAAAAGWGLTAAWAAKTPSPSSAGTCWMRCRRSCAERGRARRSRRVVLRLASSLLGPSAVPVGCCPVLAAHDRHHRSHIALSSSPSTCCMTQALAEKAATHQLLLQCLSDCGAFQRLHASVLR